MNRPKNSITFRLTFLFAAVSTTVLLSLGLLIGNTVEQHFVEQDMTLMNGKLDLVAHLLEKVRTSADLAALPAQLEDALVGHHDLALLVRQPDGQTLFSTGDVSFPSTLLAHPASPASPASSTAPQPQVWQIATAQGSESRRGIATLLSTNISNTPPLLVAIGIDIVHHEHFMRSFRRTLWLFVSLAAIAVGLLGWVAVRRGLAPLQTLRKGAAGVTASRLDYRLSLETIPIELVELAQTLNDMLARLENSFQRLQDFSSDLAHELRTPISNLMTQTQVALTRPRSAEEYREVLSSNAEEYERLARMISDMLFLAQADNGRIIPNRQAVDLQEQIRELFDFFDALADEKSLQMHLTGSGHITGDKLMLRRALANLLSNAIRHTPPAGRIEVHIESTPTGTLLHIKNTGEAIQAEHLARIFDRFYRADPSRHRNGEGAGLGLAITRSIIRAHGGEITVSAWEEGVCFTIRMV